MADTTSALVVSAVSRCARSMLGPGRAIKLCTPDLDSASGGVEAMPVAAFDGSGLLKVLSVKHPAVMLLYESVKGQDNEAGCSSTLLLSLVGPLMDRCSAMLSEGQAELHVAAGIDRAAAECESVMSSMVRAFGEGRGGWEADAHGLARGRVDVTRVAVASLRCLLPRTFPPQSAPCAGNDNQGEDDYDSDEVDEMEEEGEKEGGKDEVSEDDDHCGSTVARRIEFFSVLGPRTDATFLMEGVVVRGGEADAGRMHWGGEMRGKQDENGRGENEGSLSDWGVGQEAFRAWQNGGGGGQNVLESEAGLYGVGVCLVKDGSIGSSHSSSSSSSSSTIHAALRERGISLVLAGSALWEQGEAMGWDDVSFVSGVSLRDLVAVADDTGSALHDDFESFLGMIDDLELFPHPQDESTTATRHSNGAEDDMPEASSRRVVGRSKRRGAFGLRLNAIPVKEGWTSKHMTARGDRIRNECCSPCIAIMPVWQEHDEGEERAQSRRRKRLTRTRRRCTVVSCGPSRVHVQGMTCAVSTCVRRLHNAVNEGVLPGGGRVWMAACEDALRSAAGKAYLEGEGDEAMLVSGLVMIAFADAIREILDTRLASEGEGGGFYHVGDGGMVAAGGGCDDFLGASGAVRRAADLVKHVLGSDCLIINGSMP